jgi:hypothetical protein
MSTTSRMLSEISRVAIVVGESLEAAEAAATIVRVTYEHAAFIVPETAAVVSADPKKGSGSARAAGCDRMAGRQMAQPVFPSSGNTRAFQHLRFVPGTDVHRRRLIPTCSTVVRS